MERARLRKFPSPRARSRSRVYLLTERAKNARFSTLSGRRPPPLPWPNCTHGGGARMVHNQTSIQWLAPEKLRVLSRTHECEMLVCRQNVLLLSLLCYRMSPLLPSLILLLINLLSVQSTRPTRLPAFYVILLLASLRSMFQSI